MKNLFSTLFLIILIFFTTNAIAQENTTPKDTTYWESSFSQGLNIMQLAIINPRVGNGVSMLNLGGDIGLSAIYDSDKVYWSNQFNWQFGVQRIGAGTLPNGVTVPFSKSLDLLSLSSTLGFPFKPKGSLYYGAYLSFLSQGLPTFQGNLLTDNTPGNSGVMFSKLFSPIRIGAAPTISYFSKNKKVSFAFSPISYKSIIVANDSIAALGIHGNPAERVNGQVVSYENADNQLGSFLQVNYMDAYLKNKVTLMTSVSLYSNYLHNPEKIDVEWNADIGVKLFKKIQIALKLNLFYDYDVLVLKSDSNKPFNEWELGRAVSFTEQLLIRYRVVF
jgi:hypothetical protein